MTKVINWVSRLTIVFLYIPIAAVIFYSFNSSRSSHRFTGLTLDWYSVLIHDQPLLDALRNSLIVATLTATLATLIGFLSALALNAYRIRWGKAFLAATLIPLVVPEIVLGVALLTLFSRLHLTFGYGTLVLGNLIITLPVTSLIAFGGFASLDPSLAEASRDLGCTLWGSIRRVYAPILKMTLLAAWLLAFTLTFCNIVMSTFLSGVGTTTLPLRVFSLLKTGLTPEINALGAILIGMTVLVVLGVGVRQMRFLLFRQSAPDQDSAPSANPEAHIEHGLTQGTTHGMTYDMTHEMTRDKEQP